ncbi:hypothetical protein J6590_090257 [Homalodisca vitripennis]|nr:hypothetical protein J6590_090257 [Homalodisca vitripennis]
MRDLCATASGSKTLADTPPHARIPYCKTDGCVARTHVCFWRLLYSQSLVGSYCVELTSDVAGGIRPLPVRTPLIQSLVGYYGVELTSDVAGGIRPLPVRLPSCLLLAIVIQSKLSWLYCVELTSGVAGGIRPLPVRTPLMFASGDCYTVKA